MSKYLINKNFFLLILFSFSIFFSYTSIYIIEINDKYDKVINMDRVFIPNNRIRDLKYDSESKNFIAILENIPAIAVIKIN